MSKADVAKFEQQQDEDVVASSSSSFSPSSSAGSTSSGPSAGASASSSFIQQVAENNKHQEITGLQMMRSERSLFGFDTTGSGNTAVAGQVWRLLEGWVSVSNFSYLHLFLLPAFFMFFRWLFAWCRASCFNKTKTNKNTV